MSEIIVEIKPAGKEIKVKDYNGQYFLYEDKICSFTGNSREDGHKSLESKKQYEALNLQNQEVIFVDNDIEITPIKNIKIIAYI